MVVTIQSLGGRHPRACTVGCYKRDKNKINIYIYICGQTSVVVTVKKKYIHIFVYVYSFTQPGTRRTQRLRLPSKRHATLPCTGSFYRLGLHATRHTRVLSRGRKKGGRVKKQWKVRLQQRSNSILNSYTIKILARASRGKAEERSEAQREPALVQIRREKKKVFFLGSFFTFVHRWARQAVLIYLAVDRAHDSRAPFLRVSRPTPGALRPRHASGRRP